MDEEGQYIDPDTVESEPATGHDGDIRVTFADNRYAVIQYFTDEEMTVPIDTDACYLNPGDSIYARVIAASNPNSNQYRISEYRIREYDSDGNITNEFKQKVSDGNLRYLIPEDTSSQEMSVIPLGEYPDRQLSLDVYYVNDNGADCTLGNAGAWSVNGEKVAGNEAQVGPFAAYVLRYDYDTENYFYVGCEPACFTNDPASTGFVEFWEAEPTDTDISYRIELHRFMELSLKCSEKATVSINGGEAENIKKNKVKNLEKLKYGDVITVETTGDCTIVGGDYQHISANKDQIAKGMRYTLTVIRESGGNAADELKLTMDVNRTFDIILSDDCDYGTCTYKLDGDTVSEAVSAHEGQELTMTYKITDDNYKFADKSGGVGGFLHDIIHDSERTVTIEVSADLDGTTIDPDDWFNIGKKGK